jgi:hypothetical protein
MSDINSKNSYFKFISFVGLTLPPLNPKPYLPSFPLQRRAKVKPKLPTQIFFGHLFHKRLFLTGSEPNKSDAQKTKSKHIAQT